MICAAFTIICHHGVNANVTVNARLTVFMSIRKSKVSKVFGVIAVCNKLRPESPVWM